MKRKSARSALAAVLFVALATSSAQAQKKKDKDAVPSILPISEETNPVVLERVRYGMARDSVVGRFKTGMLCIPRDKIYARDVFGSDGDARYYDAIFQDELSAANYTTIGSSENLFEARPINQAEYAIGALVKSLEISDCQIGKLGHQGNASIEIEWQIYDLLARRVVLTLTSSGAGKAQSRSRVMTEAHDQAFADAARKLLGNPRFLEQVRLKPEEASPARQAPLFEIEIAGLRFGNSTRLNVDALAESVAIVRTASGFGSGFLIADSGYMLTNDHVVEGATKVRLVFENGQEIDATVIRSDPRRDVALLKLEQQTQRRGLSLDRSPPKIGEDVFSYGSPLAESLAGTLRKGIVSAYRNEEGLEYLQSDVATNQGNSGGPLLNGKGNVVGIAQSGIMLGGVGETGINYFIPISDALAALRISAQ